MSRQTEIAPELMREVDKQRVNLLFELLRQDPNRIATSIYAEVDQTFPRPGSNSPSRFSLERTRQIITGSPIDDATMRNGVTIGEFVVRFTRFNRRQVEIGLSAIQPDQTMRDLGTGIMHQDIDYAVRIPARDPYQFFIRAFRTNGYNGPRQIAFIVEPNFPVESK